MNSETLQQMISNSDASEQPVSCAVLGRDRENPQDPRGVVETELSPLDVQRRFVCTDTMYPTPAAIRFSDLG